MYNKRKYILLIIISLISIFIFIFIPNTKHKPIIISKNTNCDNNVKLYHQTNNTKIYSYCLDNIEVIIDNKTIELKEYLKENDISNLIEKLERIAALYDGGTTIYKDGGTKKITTSGITLIKCNTLEGNRDIYIGSSNMRYKSNFCKNNNTTFTRTYTIKKMEEIKEQMCNDCLTCICSKSLKLTLNQFQTETKTITLDNCEFKLSENKTYEFEFMLNDNTINIDDNIESIFKNSTIVEIRETNKIGLSQRQDLIK